MAKEEAAPKRRIKKVETIREKAEKAAENGNKKPRRLREKTRHLSKPLRMIARPFRFVGRYIIPPYFRNSWRELRQVTWPKFGESLRLTFAVIIFAAIFGVLIALLDFGLDKLFKKVFVK